MRHACKYVGLAEFSQTFYEVIKFDEKNEKKCEGSLNG